MHDTLPIILGVVGLIMGAVFAGQKVPWTAVWEKIKPLFSGAQEQPATPGLPGITYVPGSPLSDRQLVDRLLERVAVKCYEADERTKALAGLDTVRQALHIERTVGDQEIMEVFTRHRVATTEGHHAQT